MADITAAPDLRPALDPLAPFGLAKPLGELNTSGSEDDPTLTTDMLEILFECDRNICRGSRSAVTEGWSAIAVDEGLSSTDWDVSPELTVAGLDVYISSGRPHASKVANTNDLFHAARPAIGMPWSTPTPVVEVNSPLVDLCAVLGGAPPQMFFVREAKPSAEGDIFNSQRQDYGTWSAPQPLDLNTAFSEHSPWVDPSATVLYFASDRPGGLGGIDIWVATRVETNAAFGAPQPVPGLGTSANEADPWLSPDLRTIYFMSTRDGTEDLFVAAR